MLSLKKILKKLPVEVYILVIPAVLFLLYYTSVFILQPALFANTNLSSPVRFVIGFGSRSLQWFVLFVCVYIAIKGMWILAHFSHIYKIKTVIDSKKIKELVVKGLLWIGLFYVTGTAIQLFTSLLFLTAEPTKIIAVSDALLHSDFILFGTFPAAYLYSWFGNTFIEKSIIYSYNYLTIIIAVLFFCAFLIKPQVFRLFFIAFCSAVLISGPLWVLFPALSPQEMYRLNTMDRTFTPDIQKEISALRVPDLTARYIAAYDKVWVSPTRAFYAVSNMPSMHAAWGVIATCIGIILWRRWGYLLIVWCVLNSIGTVYLLQHYALDTLLGIVVGLVSVFIAHAALKYEKNYYSHSHIREM